MKISETHQTSGQSVSIANNHQGEKGRAMPAQLQAFGHVSDMDIASGNVPQAAWHVVQQKKGGLKAGQVGGVAPVQRVIAVQSTPENIKDQLAIYCTGNDKLEGASASGSGEVYVAQATEALQAALSGTKYDYILEGADIVVKKVVVPAKSGIRTENVGGNDIPLEALLPEKLNIETAPDTANPTFVTLQVIKGGKISCYYLIMDYAENGDLTKQRLPQAQLADFNDKAKAFYNKLDKVLTRLADSGYTSGDIKSANIFIDSLDDLRLGDFGDYSAGPYRNKVGDITMLMNDLMKSSGLKKSYSEIVEWAAGDAKWMVTEEPEIPEVPAVENASVGGGDDGSLKS